jgi:hypothetical protein
LPTLSEGEIQDKLGEYARRINKEYNYYSVRERSRMIDGYEAALKELTKPKEDTQLLSLLEAIHYTERKQTIIDFNNSLKDSNDGKSTEE